MGCLYVRVFVYLLLVLFVFMLMYQSIPCINNFKSISTLISQHYTHKKNIGNYINTTKIFALSVPPPGQVYTLDRRVGGFSMAVFQSLGSPPPP